MTWGWTGGHIFPIKSLIQHINKHEKFKKHIQNIYRFGSKHGLEHKVCNKLSNIQFVHIISGKYRRETPRIAKIRNIIDFFMFFVGIMQSLFQLKKYKIDVIFCKGGYVALPVVVAWRILRKKIIIHESDAHSGLVNKIAAHFANKIFTGFDDVLTWAETVGQILSDDIALKDTKINDILSKLPKKKTIVLVIWGSQWSYRLYKSLIHILDDDPVTMSKFVFILSLWILNNDLKPDFDRFPNVFAQEFFSQKEMGALCYRADIWLTRAGTTSLAEQKLYNMKLFIVPIAWTHDQYDNAKYYVSHFQDLLIDQRSPDFEKNLFQTFQDHVWFRKKQKQESQAMKKELLTIVWLAKDTIAKAIITV